MGVRILTNKKDDQACFFCSTSEWAFGPIMKNEEEAEAFLKYLGGIDPRILTDQELERKFYDFKREVIHA